MPVNPRHVTIANLGLGNLHSVAQAFTRAGVSATISADPDVLAVVMRRYPEAIAVSARTGEGIETLRETGRFVRITSAGKAAVRVTVAFFKREAGALRKNFSCKTCKQLCKLALSAVLAHLGVPYLDAQAVTDLPGIAPIDNSPEAAQALRALADEFGITAEELQAPIPVQTGAPVPVTQACIDMLDTPSEAPAWVGELFDLVHPKAMAAVRVALEIVDGYIDATDRIYTFACESIGMCKPAGDTPRAGAA